MSKVPVPGSLVGARMDRVLRRMFPSLPFSARERLLRTNQIRIELADGSRRKVRKGKLPLMNEGHTQLQPTTHSARSTLSHRTQVDGYQGRSPC